MSDDDINDGKQVTKDLTEDLDRTIELLESEIRTKAETLRRGPTDAPPPNAHVPVLTKKITTLTRFPAVNASDEAPQTNPATVLPLTRDIEAIVSAFKESVDESVGNALRHLKEEVLADLKQELLAAKTVAEPAYQTADTTTDAPMPTKGAELTPPPNEIENAPVIEKPKTSDMEKTYDPHAIEKSRYEHWETQGYFRPQQEGTPYCIMLPPPNVTGSLHMGHAFQDTLMDTLTRYQRMQGNRALWQCGTDHAGIATQIVVERQLAQKGETRHDLGREKFVEQVWQWKEESGGTITQQLRRMGASMDWSRERFTLDAELSAAVTKVFVSLFEEDLIYRGKRLVNWDPVLHTAISDLEVVSAEENGSLWHIRYPLSDGTGYVVVATTRPETMLGDTAVAVHPDDERYRRIIGKTIDLPLSDRKIPVIADTYVDPEFGSGCVKITPGHDFNDYEMGKRHDLPIINIFDDNAAINDNGPESYRGLDRYVARKQIITELEVGGLLARIDDHKLMVPRGDRSNAVIEPYLTDQWFVKVEPLAKPAIEAVETGAIKFVPENWDKTYFEWMRNIEDWCISRQLWWGHRIPAWYDDHGNIYVGMDEADARSRAGLSDDVKLRQDEDVLDTWFSSALWPFSTLGWPEKTPELDTYYPTNVLVTGFDIIFFWVARMIMMGLKFMGEVPFREVYIHGLVRDADGNKMSKSKGNVLDPLDLIDGIELESLVKKRSIGLMRPEDAPKIEAATRKHFPDGIPSFGTDALRFTFASMATQGRDIKFDLGRVSGYRNFCNKIWNAARFVMMMCEEGEIAKDDSGRSLSERWIASEFARRVGDIREGFETYRFDLASQALYEFVWDEFCDWSIEFAKVDINDPGHSEQRKAVARRSLVVTLEASLRAMHPIMPYVSEEIWLRLAPLIGNNADTIMLEPYPSSDESAMDEQADEAIAWIKTFILGVRRIRAEYDIAPNKEIPVMIQCGTDLERQFFDDGFKYIKRLTRASEIEIISGEYSHQAATAIAGNTSIFIPMSDLIDREAEIERLNKELERLESERIKAEAKMQNPAFVEKAPSSVVEKERAKLAEFSDNILRIKQQLENF
jgi:valyl-tRNA synthetase